MGQAMNYKSRYDKFKPIPVILIMAFLFFCMLGMLFLTSGAVLGMNLEELKNGNQLTYRTSRSIARQDNAFGFLERVEYEPSVETVLFICPEMEDLLSKTGIGDIYAKSASYEIATITYFNIYSSGQDKNKVLIAKYLVAVEIDGAVRVSEEEGLTIVEEFIESEIDRLVSRCVLFVVLGIGLLAIGIVSALKLDTMIVKDIKNFMRMHNINKS